MKDEGSNGRDRLALFFLSSVLQAEMTATDGLVEPRTVFSIREVKNTYTFPEGRAGGDCVWP